MNFTPNFQAVRLPRVRRGEKVSAATMNRYVDALNAVIARQRTPVADFARGISSTAEKLPWDFTIIDAGNGRIGRLADVELAPVFGYNGATVERFAPPRIFPDPIFLSDDESATGGYVSLFFSTGALFGEAEEIDLGYEGLARSGENTESAVIGRLGAPLVWNKGARLAGVALTSFSPLDTSSGVSRLDEIYGGEWDPELRAARRAVVLGVARWDYAAKKYVYTKYTSSPIFLPIWY